APVSAQYDIGSRAVCGSAEMHSFELPRRTKREEERRPRLLVEVEVLREIAEDRLVLADVRATVGAAVGLGIEPPATEEVVLDELEVGVEAEGLVVDVALLRVGAYHERRHAQSVSLAVD